MNEKKEEHDILEKFSTFDLWRADIDKMLEVLEKIEAKEEEERLSAGGVKNDGKKKKRKAPVKDAVKAAATAKAAGIKGKEAEPVKVPKAPKQVAKKDPTDMSLKERLALKSKNQPPIQETVFKGL